MAICARDDEGVNHAVARLADKGTRVFGAGVDAADADAYKGWIDTAIGQLGGLDVFVHNVSGASGRGEEQWTKNLQLDVLGLTRAIEAITPAFEDAGGGSIVALSSIAAQEEFAGPASFGPMKAAMVAIANNYAQALAGKGIRINVVSPGPVFFEGGNWDTIKSAREDFYNMIVEKIPMKRMGDPREIANAVVFLASSAASLITGANVVIDGGYTKRIKF